MPKKIVALFVEGDTEIEFYKAVIKKTRELKGAKFDCKVKYKNIKGIGKYKDDCLRKFKELKREHKKEDIYVYLCIDSDVFELTKKPPINKAKVKKSLLDEGAKKVAYISAQKSIEDWFLYDFEGVIQYLRLPQKTKLPHEKTGLQKLKKLFSMANKIYIKGDKTDGFIDKLSISIIMEKCCSSLKPLFKILKFDCRCVCGNTICKLQENTKSKKQNNTQ